MDLELKERAIVVAGSAHGIGRAIAHAFADEGAHVVLVDRDPVVSDVAAQLEKQSHGKALAHIADVADYEAMQKTAQRIEQELGPVDHVVFSVGIGTGKTGFPFWNIEPNEWQRIFQVNLQGAVHTIHAFMPAMIERQRGTFLFIGSVAGQTGSQTDPPYSASKAALINFAQCAAKDLAPYDIRVNILNPGMVDTKLSRSIWAASNQHLPPSERPDYEAWSKEKFGRMIPLRRWTEAEDVAAMAVFLASTRAKNVTGQAINVDGGYVMHS